MPTSTARLRYLYEQFTSDTATPEEIQEFWQVIAERAVDDALIDQARLLFNQVPTGVEARRAWSGALEQIFAQPEAADSYVEMEPAIRKPLWFWYSAAASILILLAGAGLLYKYARTRDTPAVVATTDLKPGGNKAVLTLASGQQVILDNVQNGLLATQGTSKIVKTASGQLAYQKGSATEGSASSTTPYNMVSTPAGGTYQVTLPDGSKVWLNAESSIRFPATFTGDSREVAVTGEVYMEVAKDARRPFHVTARDMTVSVLGTSFDVSAYEGEPMTTTLVAGSVRAERGNAQVLLKPGQQAEAGDGLTVHPGVDIEAITAWKDGLFIFNHAPIQSVMKALSRWYAVPVKYEGTVTASRITVMLRRESYASKNLKILEESGYHFRIEQRAIVVLP